MTSRRRPATKPPPATWRRCASALAALTGLLACWAACAPAVCCAQSAEAAEGDRVFSPMISGQEPVSQWLAGPRPEDAAAPADDGGSVYPEGFGGCRRRPIRDWLGRCGPLERESWLRRPLSATWFLGVVEGGPAIGDWLTEKSGIFGGVRLGWDFDHYWGTEFRLSFGQIELHDTQRAIEAQHWYDTIAGYPENDPYRHRFDGRRQADLFLYDINLLYYPWGDTPIRPYFLLGLGGTQVSMADRLGRRYDSTHLTMPFGVGLKYHWTDWMALRFEVADNVAFGSQGIGTLHHISIIGAAELRFGGSRRSYWPWVPGRRAW